MIVPIQERSYQLAGIPSPEGIHDLFEPGQEIPVFEELQDGLVSEAYRSRGLTQVMTINVAAGQALRSVVCITAVDVLQRGAYFGPAVDARTERVVRPAPGMGVLGLWLKST